MATDKRKHAFWLTDAAKEMVEIDAHLDNCGSQSEFVEKAIRFYDGYVHANKTGAYLPRALQEMLEGTLGVFGDRLGKLLFKLAVEESMLMHIISHDTDITPDELEHLRGRCVKDVMRTHGMIGFKDILRFQKEL